MTLRSVTAKEMVERSMKVSIGMEYCNASGKIEEITEIPTKEEKIYNLNGEVLAFTWEGDFYVVPFHSENYLEILEGLNYKKDKDLWVPFSEKNSYPIEDKLKWRMRMSISRSNYVIV